MLDHLERLVSAESPSKDPGLLAKCAGVIADTCKDVLGVAPEVTSGEHPVVRVSFGAPRVMLLGHFDTVWPAGTIDRWPFAVRDGNATGPGVFDMKAGIVQGLYAIASLDDADGVELLLTSDEELGSLSTQGLIEERARAVEAVLVLEPSEQGALKVARKGCSTYTLDFTGRASHAGLDPWNGRSALVALAHAVLDVGVIGDAHGPSTVTPTIARAGTTSNTVPATAQLLVDVRAETITEQQRVDRDLRALASRERQKVEGVVLRIERTADRPPLERTMAEPLFERAKRISGFEGLEAVGVGGGSDGNFTAAIGTPTLDGLGAVGAGAHAEGEHIVVDKMEERARLVAALTRDLLGGDG
jgi:glutamate carboxypeptidase